MSRGKKCPACKKGTPLWFISWADMATLLLCFFVIIVAYSTVEITKFKELAGTFKDQFGVQRIEKISPILGSQNLIGSEFQQEVRLVELREKIRVLATTLIDNGQAEVEEKQEGFLLRIREDSLLTGDGKKVVEGSGFILDQIANLLVNERNIVEVRGHVDAQKEEGTSLEGNNWYQGAVMAVVLAKRLAAGGVAPERLFVSTSGQYSPVADNNSPEGRKANRRIEIMIRKDLAGTLPIKDDAEKNIPEEKRY
ncbi:MAG: OmpA family protein [Magnetococcales bacterium]|nr:OmpA family protein [Magnetococcales bacterium]MBF0632554.1 OmpA family protein [Magnetococcales bacterium]